MKKILLLLIALFSVVGLDAQRMKIGKQLQKAPSADYMILTDANGEQYYTPFSIATTSIQNVDLVDNGNGTLTWVDTNGSFTFKQGWTEVTNNDDGTWTYLYPDGSSLDLDVCELMIDSNCLQLIDNGDGSFTLQYSNGLIIGTWWYDIVNNGEWNCG